MQPATDHHVGDRWPRNRRSVLSLRAPGIKAFIRDWLSLVGLLVAYEALRDLVSFFGIQPHDLSWIDRALFGGQLPTLALQRTYYHPQAVGWQDLVATLIYFAHFLLPVGLGLYLWFADRGQFRRFAAALLTLCGLAFVTYLVLPTTPPWLGDPRAIHEVTNETIRKLSLPEALVAIYVHHDYNLYAAFPSLHAAFPVVVALYGWLHNRLLGLALAARAVLTWVVIVYLGEHYVVDILAGTLYAAVAILVVERAVRSRVVQDAAVDHEADTVRHLAAHPDRMIDVA